MRQGKKPRHQLGHSNRSRLEQPELLEHRRLLSATVCAAPPPSLMPNVVPNMSLVLPAAAPAGDAGNMPGQIGRAYGFNQLAGDGNGQTIAIVDAYNDPNIAADLSVFDKQFALPDPPSFSVVGQSGAAATAIPTNAGWAGEISLDVEWAHATAPGASILLVEASSASLANLLTAVDYARHAADVSVVTMSWGGGEFYGEIADDTYFTTPAGHNGVTFIAASGDLGSQVGVEWPASSPDVLSVGGTTLTALGPDGAYSSESPWVGSTGGPSAVESEPSFQQAAQQSGARTVPDVAYDANPNTGFAVYDSVPYYGMSGWQEYGGTSAGAPQWAALIAIADQARVAAGLGTLDGATQTLPALYAPYGNPAIYAANYHDVTAVARQGWAGKQVIDIGYDLQTGLGSPRASQLVQTLSQSPGISFSVEPELVIGITTSWTTAPGRTTASIIRTEPTHGISIGDGGDSADPPKLAPPPAAQPAPMIFNDSPIHHGDGPAAVSVRGTGGVELPGLGASQRGNASTLPAVAEWIGVTDGSLISWLAGSGTANLAKLGIAPSFIDEDISAATIAAPNAAGSIASAASNLVTQLAAPLVTGPAAIYRFADFDPVGIFSDSMADFARESASIAPLYVPHAAHRAWIVTGIVLGVDALLAARWYAERIATKKQANATNPQSPQAGPLPTGL